MKWEWIEHALMTVFASGLSLWGGLALARRSERKKEQEDHVRARLQAEQVAGGEYVSTAEFREYKAGINRQFLHFQTELAKVHQDNREDHGAIFGQLKEISVAIAKIGG